MTEILIKVGATFIITGAAILFTTFLVIIWTSGK